MDINPCLSRRRFLQGLGVAGAAALLEGAFVKAAFATTPVTGRDLLVCVFLRGGMDGLNAVVPAFEAGYYDLRPTIAVPEARLLPLDADFGLHPMLADLHPFYGAGTLAIVAAAGNPNPSRSHFDAQKSMELASYGATPTTKGWINRHLSSLSTVGRTPFAGLAFGDTMPLGLYGDLQPLSMSSLDGFRLKANGLEAASYQAGLWSLYDSATTPLAGGRTLLEALDTGADAGTSPASGVSYPASSLGTSLRDVARLRRAGVGLEAVSIDVPNWDLHVEIGSPESGALALKFADLGASLAAFVEDLGASFAQTTIVVMSEFGRRVAENGGGGTDHGHGGAMFVLGGAVRGGRVFGPWPGLDALSLDHGDLAITTDYRDVLAEIVSVRLGNPDLAAVFPGYTPRPVGIV